MKNPAFVFKPEQLDPTDKPLVRARGYVGYIVHEWRNGTVAVMTERGPLVVRREEVKL